VAALALTGATLAAAPAVAAPVAADPPSPLRTALRAPLAGHVTVASQMRAARRENLQAELTPRVIEQARAVARVRGNADEFKARERRRALRGAGPAELRETLRELRDREREIRRAKRERAERRRERREAAAAASAAAAAEAATPAPGTAEPAPTTGGTASAGLEAIAACESGGDPSAVGGGGAYRGKYQFDQSTWESVGGSGDPAAASEAEQDARAAQLYSQSGSAPWPTCG